MAVRLKDIAQSLNVSIVTVSKALRNHPDIAKETRERVLQRVKELNYRPNMTARSLVTGRSSLIGLVIPDLVHPFFTEIAKSLSSALRQRNYFLIIASSEGDPVLEREEIEQMLAHRLDALVIASCQTEPESLRAVMTGGPPIILLDRYFAGLPCNFVGANDYKIGELATEHLIAAGRKRIAHIRGPENNVGRRRLEAYRDTLERHGLSAPEKFVITVEGATDSDGEARGRIAMEQVMALSPRPDALFCFNDLIAVGAMARALEGGLRIPEDVAIIGCGNYHYDSLLRVSLSSVEQHVHDMGQRIAKLIFHLLDAETSPKARRIILDPTLVVRASTSG